ncbi:MAG: DUF2807 domain-containing protein [Flavobacteriales bacterium]|nr:DUF2807 domain-containing protein [Flavobacteriales bacterium]
MGEGEVTKEKRSTLEFDEIEIPGSFDVILKQARGKVNSVEITAQPNLLPNILTNVSGDRLELQELECMQSSDVITVQVNMVDLSKIIYDGSGDVSTLGELNFETLKLVSEGSGDIQIKANVEGFSVDLDGSGDITLAGTAGEIDLDNDGSGSIQASDLKSAQAEVQNDGSGNIQVFATEALDMVLNGSGDIEYRGNPEDFKKDITGSGSIRSMN